jgi:hypothetical protein
MSRKIRFLVLALITSVALGATACASVAGPSHDDCTGAQGSGWCD